MHYILMVYTQKGIFNKLILLSTIFLMISCTSNNIVEKDVNFISGIDKMPMLSIYNFRLHKRGGENYVIDFNNCSYKLLINDLFTLEEKSENDCNEHRQLLLKRNKEIVIVSNILNQLHCSSISFYNKENIIVNYNNHDEKIYIDRISGEIQIY